MNPIGQRIRNNGDVCNAPREGIITDIKKDRWGSHAVILWDQDENIGWMDGEAVTINEPVSVVALHLIGSGRWQLLPA